MLITTPCIGVNESTGGLIRNRVYGEEKRIINDLDS